MEEALGRHHRTSLLVAALAEATPEEGAALLEGLVFGVSIDRERASTRRGQAALLTAANVLARTSGALTLTVPAVDVLIPGLHWRGTLDQVVIALVEWAGGRVTRRQPSSGVHIGAASDEGFVLAQGDDWNAYVDDPDRRIGDGPLALGAVSAAHLAAARAFHLAIGSALGLRALSRAPIGVRLGFGSPVPPQPHAPAVKDFTLIGAGAVGDALLWALVLGGVSIAGTAHVIDPQTLDATNLNRHLLAGVNDIGRAKSEVARTFLSAAARAESVVGRFVPAPSPIDTLVSTVDNNEARYQAQASFPRTLYHAATQAEHVSVGVFDFRRGACLGCLFPRGSRTQAQLIAEETGLDPTEVATVLAADGVLSAPMLEPIARRLGVARSTLEPLIGRNLREVYARELCGRLPIGATPGAPVATIAYASGLAGALLAAELVRDADPRLAASRSQNYLQMAAASPAAAWISFREKEHDCPLMCGSPSLQAFVKQLHAGASA